MRWTMRLDPAMMDIWINLEGTQTATTWEHQKKTCVTLSGSWDCHSFGHYRFLLSVCRFLSIFSAFPLHVVRAFSQHLLPTHLLSFRQAFGKRLCEAFTAVALYGKYVEKTMVSAQLSFELHWSPQLGDLKGTYGLRCLAPARWRQPPGLVLHQTTWSVASKVVNSLMLPKDLPLYKPGFVLDQVHDFQQPIEGKFNTDRGMGCITMKFQLRVSSELQCLTATLTQHILCTHLSLCIGIPVQI